MGAVEYDLGCDDVIFYIQKSIRCIPFSVEYTSVVWVENGDIIFVRSAD